MKRIQPGERSERRGQKYRSNRRAFENASPNRTSREEDGLRPYASSRRRKSGSFKQEKGERRTSDSIGLQHQQEQPLREDRLEGKNPILEALKAGREIEKLWYLKDSTDPVLKRLIAQVGETQAVLHPVDRSTLDRLTVTHAHQGVIAQVSLLPTVEWEELLIRAEERGEDPFLLIADEIQDSYNLGSLFRIAEAAGVHGIILPRHRQVGLDAVTAKASAGAIHHVPCARVTNLTQTIEALQARGIWVGGATMEGERLYDSVLLRGPLALVIGNEGRGISPLVRKRCDFLISIPMKGTLNSLNAAVAAGIVVFEAVRIRSQV